MYATPRFVLPLGSRCSYHTASQDEVTYGRKHQVARGLPQLQVRLVYDEMRYPHWYIGPRDYYPQLFVDEFWMTDDQVWRSSVIGYVVHMLP